MKSTLKKNIFVFISLFLFALAFEGLSFLVFRIAAIVDENRNYFQAYENSGLYENVDLASYVQAKKSLHQATTFDAFRHLRLPPDFSSPFFNTDSSGRRLTASFLRENSALPIRTVGFFGGSTLFGIGAESDAQTIPSYFAKTINQLEPNINYTVLNYGVGSYNNNQEMVYLIEALGETHFDVVVFYDFVNESLTAYREKTIEPQRRSQSMLTPNIFDDVMLSWLRTENNFFWINPEWLNKSYSYRMLRVLPYRFNNLLKKRAINTNPDEENKAQIDRVIHLYARNYQVITALGKTFGFQPFFVIQPSLFTKAQLSKNEQMIPHLKDTNYVLFEKAVYKKVRETFGTKEDFLDLSGIFDDTVGTIYVDDHHMSSKGNQIIGSKIATWLLSISLAERKNPLPLP